MTAKSNKTLIIFSIITGLFTLFIWSNSLLDSQSSGQLSGFFAKLLCAITGEATEAGSELLHMIIRKAAHFTEFFILGILYFNIKYSIDGKAVSSLLFFPVSCTLFTAVTDEFIQSFTGRGSSVRDVLLDFCGAVTGIVLCVIIAYFKKRGKKQG